MTDEAIRLGIADRLEQAMRGGWGSVRIFETDEQAQLAIDILRAIPQEPVAPTIIRELAQFFLDELELDRAGTEDWVAQGDLEVETFIAEAKRLCAGDTKSDGARSPHIPDTQEEANERGDIEGTGGRSYYRPSDTPFADEALRQLDADLAPLRSTSEPIAQGQRKTIWQPIETAPKDGTEVVLYGACYPEHSQSRYAKDANVGWFSGGEWKTRVYGETCDATHWMPLLPAPVANGHIAREALLRVRVGGSGT